MIFSFAQEITSVKSVRKQPMCMSGAHIITDFSFQNLIAALHQCGQQLSHSMGRYSLQVSDSTFYTKKTHIFLHFKCFIFIFLPSKRFLFIAQTRRPFLGQFLAVHELKTERAECVKINLWFKFK